MSEKLKPCPWCGNRNVRVIHNGVFYVHCFDPDCTRRTIEAYWTEEEAVEKWNALPRPSYDAATQKRDDIGVREG